MGRVVALDGLPEHTWSIPAEGRASPVGGFAALRAAMGSGQSSPRQPSMKHVFFVSHEWTSNAHPDHSDDQLATFRTLTEGEEYAKGGLKELSSPMVPCIITTMLAFFVGNAFLNVYGMAIDTILLCFCVDKDRKGEKKYMSPELERYIDDVSGKEK